MAYTSLSDWPLSSLTSPTTNPSKALSADDWAKLADYLEQHPAGSLPPTSFGLDGNVIMIPAALQNNADDAVSSPESSSATSSSNDRQDSAPIEQQQQRANSNKRKTSSETFSQTTTTALKDSRRGNAKSKEAVLHTHQEQEAPASIKSSKKGGSTSEKRKEQNRNAQRAFRERRERHTKELEDKVAELQAQAEERDQENQNLKDMVTRLRSENERLLGGSFTFSMPTGGLSSSPSATSSAPLTVSAGSMNGGSSPSFANPILEPSFGSFASKSSSFLPFATPNHTNGATSAGSDSPNDLFAPPLDRASAFNDFSDSLFTPSGEHLNPLAGFEDILAASPPSSATQGGLLVESALSPGSTEALFSSYRDPSPSATPSGKSTSTLGFGGFERPSPTTAPATAATSSASSAAQSREPGRSPPAPEASMSVAEAKCNVFRQTLGSLRGSEDYDLDSLCKDMMQKATCKQAAAVALEKAVSDDIDIHSFFTQLLSDPSVKATYHKNN